MTTSASDAEGIDRGNPDHLIESVFRATTAVDSFTAQMRRAFALNAHERLALAALWADGPMTMTQLGEWIPLSRAAVTTLVDRLEQAGYVTRRSDPHDRRRTVVTVSVEALDRMVPVIGPWAEDVQRLAREFDDSEWAAISRFLGRLGAVCSDHAHTLKQLSDTEIQSRTATHGA